MTFTKKQLENMAKATAKALREEGAEIMWRPVEHGVDFPFRKPPYVVFRGLQINPETQTVVGKADAETTMQYCNLMLDYYFSQPTAGDEKKEA
jgi:hypothetical protein